MKRPKEFSPPSNPGELVIAVVSIVLLILVMASLGGCVSKLSGPEPKWAPPFYRYKPVGTRCTFYSPMLAHTVDCDEPEIQDMLMFDAKYMPLLIEKFNSCETWK